MEDQVWTLLGVKGKESKSMSLKSNSQKMFGFLVKSLQLFSDLSTALGLMLESRDLSSKVDLKFFRCFGYYH